VDSPKHRERRTGSPAGTRQGSKALGFHARLSQSLHSGYAPYPSAVAAHGIFQAQPLDFATIKLFLDHITNLLKRRTVVQRGCQNVDPMSRPTPVATASGALARGGPTRSERVSAVQHRPCLPRRCRATRPGTRCFLPRRVEKLSPNPDLLAESRPCYDRLPPQASRSTGSAPMSRSLFLTKPRST
jgi:hypothetical protein